MTKELNLDSKTNLIFSKSTNLFHHMYLFLMLHNAFNTLSHLKHHPYTKVCSAGQKSSIELGMILKKTLLTVISFEFILENKWNFFEALC